MLCGQKDSGSFWARLLRDRSRQTGNLMHVGRKEHEVRDSTFALSLDPAGISPAVLIVLWIASTSRLPIIEPIQRIAARWCGALEIEVTPGEVDFIRMPIPPVWGLH